jgi:hypothetical protein
MAVGTSGATASTGGTSATSGQPSRAPATAPDVELREANAAFAGGQQIAFDGVAEGLEWPALQKALAKKMGGAPLVVQAAREVPIVNVLRTVFVLRASGVRLQTPDDRGAMYVVDLPSRREPSAPVANPEGPKPCHLAVFVQPSGALRVATGAGPQESPNADAFARALDASRAECALRYVAFGAASNDVPWGAVFDVMVAVDRAKAAGPARYVLADAVHSAKP